METKIDFSKLVGQKATLYYHCGVNQFQLGSVIFEVLEDESDGYRSYLGSVQIVTRSAVKKQGDILGEVIISEDGDFYYLNDCKTNHIWIRFGTDNSDEWYPSFIFDFMPYNPIVEIDDIKSLLN